VSDDELIHVSRKYGINEQEHGKFSVNAKAFSSRMLLYMFLFLVLLREGELKNKNRLHGSTNTILL
jgi:hypothetical protein